MKNTTRYLNTIMRFRSDLQAVNERLRPEYEHIGRYRDSKSYPQNKKMLDDKRNAQVDALRREAQEQLSKIVDDMRQTYEQKPSKAPTPEQLAVLQALKMRDSVNEDELKQALNAVKGCPLCERVIGEIAAKNHHVLGMEQELTSDTIRRSLDSLKLNGETLIAHLEYPGEDRRTAVNSGNYTLFMLDQEPKDEADTMRIFGHVTNYQQFAEAVNGEGA